MAKDAHDKFLSDWVGSLKGKTAQERAGVAVLGRALLRVLPTNLCDNRFRSTFIVRNLDRAVLPNFIAAAQIWRANFKIANDLGTYLWGGILPLQQQSGYNLAVYVAKDLSYPNLTSATHRIIGWGSNYARNSAMPHRELVEHLYSQMEEDVSFLKSNTFTALQERPLWNFREPSWAERNRVDLERALSDPIWEDWVAWLNRRIRGQVADDRVEDAFIEFTWPVLSQGYYAVNNEIRRRLNKKPLAQQHTEDHDKSLPHVPEQRPAAVEPFWLGDRLTLPKSPAVSDLDKDLLVGVLSSLRDNLLALAAGAESESNIDRRAGKVIRHIAEQIPTGVPQQDCLFTVAHGLDWMAGYQSIVNQEWPGVLAAQYSSTAIQYERTVRQFPRWREFVRNAERDRFVLPADIANTNNATQEVVSILRDATASTVVDGAIPTAFQNLQNWLLDDDQNMLGTIEHGGSELLTSDLLESIDNVAKRLAEHALKGMQSTRQVASLVPQAFLQLMASQTLAEGWAAYREAFSQEFPRAMERAGKEHARSIPSIISTAVLFLVTLALSGSGLLAMGVAGATAAARKFAWLRNIVELIKKGQRED